MINTLENKSGELSVHTEDKRMESRIVKSYSVFTDTIIRFNTDEFQKTRKRMEEKALLQEKISESPSEINEGQTWHYGNN